MSLGGSTPPASTIIKSVTYIERRRGAVPNRPVYYPIPPHVKDLLVDVPASQKGNANERYFFWTGNGNPKTVVSNRQRSYGKFFKLAVLKGADGTANAATPICCVMTSLWRPCFPVCAWKTYRRSLGMRLSGLARSIRCHGSAHGKLALSSLGSSRE